MPLGKKEERLPKVRLLSGPDELKLKKSTEQFLADEVFQGLIAYLRSEADKLQIVAISPFIELPDGQKYGFAKLFEAILP